MKVIITSTLQIANGKVVSTIYDNRPERDFVRIVFSDGTNLDIPTNNTSTMTKLADAVVALRGKKRVTANLIVLISEYLASNGLIAVQDGKKATDHRLLTVNNKLRQPGPSGEARQVESAASVTL